MAVALDAPSLHGVDAAMYDTGAQKINLQSLCLRG